MPDTPATNTIVAGSGLNISFLKDGDLKALDQVLADYVAIGCGHVEITARRLDMIAGGRIVEERADAVAEILARHDIRPVLHADHAINMMDLPNADMHRALAESSIALAGRMGMASIVMHSGCVPADVWLASRQDLRSAERDAFRRLGDRAGEAGVQLAVENLIADPWGRTAVTGADPRAVADQVAAIDHPAVGGCLDFGHAFLSAPVLGFDFVEAVAAFSEQVWHLHLHDNCGIPNVGRYPDEGSHVSLGIGDLHMPMGWGTIPWADVLPKMRFRPGTYAMIELKGRYRAIEADVAATAARFGAYWNGTLPLDEALPGGALKEAAE